MHDWKKFVRERMEAMSLSPELKDEVILELAAHFEDVFEEARAEGHTEADALERATTEEVDWPQLATQIQRTKQQEGVMNERTKRFWLPGFISLATASIFLMILAKVSYEPRVILMRSSQMVLVYPIWLLGQPLFGALGAYFSRRGGGTVWARLAAGLFPSLVLLAMISVVLLIRAFEHSPGDVGSGNLSMYARAIVGVVVIPSVGLLMGALPFLRESKTQQGLAGN